VDTRDFFWSLSEQPMLKKIPVRVLPCPISEQLGRDGFYLPSGLALTDDEIQQVIRTVHDVLG
jgi:perosamine synthetase